MAYERLPLALPTLPAPTDNASQSAYICGKRAVKNSLWTVSGPRIGGCGNRFANVGALIHCEHMTTNTPIRTQDDLRDAWRRVMDPLSFRSRCLWLMLIDADGVPLPQLTKLTDLPDRPTLADQAGLERFLHHFSGTEVRVAVFVGRPDTGLPSADDRAWSEAIYLACDRAAVFVETVHVGTSAAITTLPLEWCIDELRATG